MSYSFSVPAGPVEDLRERAEKAAADCKARVADYGGTWVEEADGDIAAAIDAAERLTKALAGENYVHVSASISGHANAGRDAAPGWSNDQVSVSVFRARVEAPAEAGA